MKKKKNLAIVLLLFIAIVMMLIFLNTKVSEVSKNETQVLQNEEEEKEITNGKSGTASKEEEIITDLALNSNFYVEFVESNSTTDDLIREINLSVYYKESNIFTHTVTLEANPESVRYEGKVISKDYGYEIYLSIDNFFNFVTLKILIDFDGKVTENYESVPIPKVRHDEVKYLGFQNENLYISIVPYMTSSPGSQIKFYVLDQNLNIISNVNNRGFSEAIYVIPNDRYVSSVDVSLQEEAIKITYEYYESQEDFPLQNPKNQEEIIELNQ